MIEPEFRPGTASAQLPRHVRTMLTMACRALAGTEAEVTAIDVVSHVPDSVGVPALLTSVRDIAAEFGCVASVAVANGAIEIRLCRSEASGR